MYDRDRILEATDLGALADELLGPRRGTWRSGTWACPSPQHGQTGRTPPVSVFRDRAGTERWHCHGCGIGGTAVDLVMAIRDLGVGDALAELAGWVGMGEAPTELAPSRPLARPKAVEAPGGDLEGLTAFVDECAERLWRPEGRPVLRWLTVNRCLPADVLRANHIGADPGLARQPRPDGMPATGWAAVLPVREEGRVVFAQLRALSTRPGRPRYLNAANHLAANPRLAVYEPVAAVGRCVVVTEGAIDALSANAAGFRAEAVLGASVVSNDQAAEVVAGRLARYSAAVVLAFDADEAGQRATAVLGQALREIGLARPGSMCRPKPATSTPGSVSPVTGSGPCGPRCALPSRPLLRQRAL